MIHRTDTGLLLEKILHGMKDRYALCWNGEDANFESYDCGCCLMRVVDSKDFACGCVCHDCDPRRNHVR